MQPANVRPRHLAAALGMPEYEVFEAARAVHEWFKKPFVKTRKGKSREIDPPTTIGKRRLKRLGKFVAKESPLHPCAHGSVKGCSPFTAAKQHLGARLIVRRDVKDCFPSLSAERFEAELIHLGFLRDIAHLLTALLLYRGRLPQGSPASNAALNLYFFRTDEEIRLAAAKFGGRYTRYADDMVISVVETAAIPRAVALLEQSIAALGFAVNTAKIERVRFLHEERTVNGGSDQFAKMDEFACKGISIVGPEMQPIFDRSEKRLAGHAYRPFNPSKAFRRL